MFINNSAELNPFRIQATKTGLVTLAISLHVLLTLDFINSCAKVLLVEIFSFLTNGKVH